jgi:hypothetical protein
MSVDLAWYLSEPSLALVDVRIALADVAARHPGVVVLREADAGGTEEVPHEDIDSWDEGFAFFKVGFPTDQLASLSGEGAGPPSDGGGLAWGDILFSCGDEDDDDAESGASMLISSKLTGADRLWPKLSAFAGEAAAELGARSQEEVDAGIKHSPERPLTWAQIRMWIRGEDLEIIEEDAEHMSVVLRWEHDGRSQTVTLARETHLDLPWLRLSSFFGKEDQMPHQEALAQNETLLASIARSEEDGRLYLVQRVPLSAVTPTFLDAILWDLGAEADLLESEISSGRDEH